MGGGYYSDDTYRRSRSTRQEKGEDDFQYSEDNIASKKVHPNLDPLRISSKPYGKLESRDNNDHPESNAVLMCLDVTGSNIDRARIVQKKLPTLMELVQKYLKDPQIAIAANDDFRVQPEMCVQISDFESDNRIDEHIRSLILVGDGGGNSGESYDLLLYAAARKTVLDCMEKRSKKGYLFMYADEPLRTLVKKSEVKRVFGDALEENILIERIIAEAKALYHVYLLSTVRPEYSAGPQYRELFGEDSVITIQHPDMICEVVGATIGFNEELISQKEAVKSLVRVGMDRSDADALALQLAAKVRRPKGRLSA